MRKNSHFSGQPLYGQVIKLLDKSKILQFSCEKGGRTLYQAFQLLDSSGGDAVCLRTAGVERHRNG